MEALNNELQDQHRMFLAATEDPALNYADLEALSATTMRQVGASFCVYYLSSPDGRQFVPQLPGAGFGFMAAHHPTSPRQPVPIPNPLRLMPICATSFSSAAEAAGVESSFK